MSLFIDQPVKKRRSFGVLPLLSLVVALSGFFNAIGFFLAPPLATIALIRLRLDRRRGGAKLGRAAAILAIVISTGFIGFSIVALIVVSVIAYASLPSPTF